MHGVLLAARLVLAAVFAVAGVAKLADLRGSRAAVEGFGVPERLAEPLGTLLPIAELAIAVALIPSSSARYGALGASVLLLLFCGAIVRSMIRGEAPDCHCFGQLHSEPAGPRTLVRNALLLALAVFVAAAGWSDSGSSAVAWIGNLSDAGAVAVGGGLALAVLAVATAAGLLALLRQNGRLLLRIDELERRIDDAGVAEAVPPPQPHHGLPIGAAAPDFSLSGLYGETVTLESLTSAEYPVVLLFTDPNCGPCNALLPQIAAWQREHAGQITLAVISRGSVDDNLSKIREHGVSGVWLDDDRAVAEAYQVLGTPGAVIVDQDRRIASGVVGGADAITSLVAGAVGVPVPVIQVLAPEPPQLPQSLPLGTQAPALNLPDLAGNPVGIAAEDRDTLVLFWNPGCGFCQRMLDDLRSWEHDPPAGAPRLLLISAGSAEDNTAMGLKAPIVLDQTFELGSAFGTNGTPSAMLVDQGGKIASGLAVGAPAVMELAAGRAPAAS